MLPVAALALVLPRHIATLISFDFSRHLVPAGGEAEGLLRRTIDLLNLSALLCPLALAAAVGLIAQRCGLTRELAILITLLTPLAVPLLAIHPAQGRFRDWDVYAPTGVALSMLCAALLGETLRAAPRFAWLGVAVALGAIAPSAQWLVHHTDLESGLMRVHAFATEPPARLGPERTAAWDYLGIRNSQLGRWEIAAAAFARAAEAGPSPRVLMEWGYAEERSGNFPAARRAYQRLVEKSPDDLVAWRSLAVTALRLGDQDEARRAAGEVLKRRPSDAAARQILEALAP